MHERIPEGTKLSARRISIENEPDGQASFDKGTQFFEIKGGFIISDRKESNRNC